ncbi:MAG: glycoside hydrolase family 2 TIM barrel-domain containing protein [Flavobacteriaceae bacterium]
MVAKIVAYFAVVSFFTVLANAQNRDAVPEFSKAGFYTIPDAGRQVLDFNLGWRFHKGPVNNAEQEAFNDSNWERVNTPHGLELVSAQASGSNNYQGEAWYRKHFKIHDSLENKRLIVYFEAIMGKCKVWVNGKLLKEHFGGFLPFSVDISNVIVKGEDNVIAVWADNSNDDTYPPGKPQQRLDFSYFGGIYRDVWLIATNSTYISDANRANKVAGGGLFVHVKNVSETKATAQITANIINQTTLQKSLSCAFILKNAEGVVVAKSTEKTALRPNAATDVKAVLQINNPKLWTPQTPYLYNLEVLVTDKIGKTLDGVRQKTGIRSIEFRGKDGLFLNGKPYGNKLIGANRHQDFAYLGNALPNSGQWRDAVILKEAGCNVIRAAHYPPDPAFLDACDQLGLFFINATPGWQFWNKENKLFEQRVYQDIRNMVRRDRNRPSILLWEPILNETHYPDYFAEKVHKLIHEEYPFQGAFTACDSHAKGQQYFDVVYSHPYKSGFYNALVENTQENQTKTQLDYTAENRSIFTREWGDCVDDWNAHNSPSRAARNWGEQPQLLQAKHYAKPNFVYTSLESLYNTPQQHVGGTLWHAFDHQRGYHPDPFYGGLTDVFRQPKYAYQLFKSQRQPSESQPMVYVANEMTPFSPSNITVFTNCDEVRLIRYETDTLQLKVDKVNNKMPSPVLVFKDAFDFATVKNLHRSGKKKQAYLIAEGLINNKVVVSEIKRPALRPTRIILTLQNNNIPLVANGSDIITVIAAIADDNGTIKRLNNDMLRFEIEGEGTLVGNASIMANPIPTQWGTAPVLVKSTTTPGPITVKASILKEGINTPQQGSITFSSVAADIPLLFSDEAYRTSENNASSNNNTDTEAALKQRILELEKQLNKQNLKEVEKQQEEFEGGKQ